MFRVDTVANWHPAVTRDRKQLFDSWETAVIPDAKGNSGPFDTNSDPASRCGGAG
jgi:hypothetical protein